MSDYPYILLSDSLKSAARRSGNEWGWRPETIPLVIDEAEELGLVNIGGQLQFLLPNATCECYWIDVNALIQEPHCLDWTQRVAYSAQTARVQIEENFHYDFIAEGRKAFREPLAAYEATGGDLSDCIWFIWYLKANPKA